MKMPYHPIARVLVNNSIAKKLGHHSRLGAIREQSNFNAYAF